jgi:GNAT superfamily N-acetyltransferase
MTGGGSAGSSSPADRTASWFRIRPARANDSRFLTDMLVEATNWDGLTRRARVAILDDPRVGRYIAGWPRPGDFGSVAVDANDTPIGACWARLFPANDPGDGFVASGVPELVLGVAAIWRARGVGRTLLRAIAEQAVAYGHLRISLHVNRGNYAHRLYVSEGYVTASSSDASVTMVRVLR